MLKPLQFIPLVAVLTFLLNACNPAPTTTPLKASPGPTGDEQSSEPAAFSIVSDDGPPYSTPQQDGIFDRMVQEAFQRQGISVNISFVPSERALQNINNGLDDGNFSRVVGLESIYPNIVMVPEVLLPYEYIAFARQSDIRLDGWESLAPYNVSYINGWKILERHVTSYHSLTTVHDQYALFEILDQGHVDLVIYSRLGGEAIIKELGLTGIYPIEPPLLEIDMFLYLNKKHAALAEPLAEALRQMKSDGSYQAILSTGK